MIKLLKSGWLVLLLAGCHTVASAQQAMLDQPVTVSFHQTTADSALRLLQVKTGLDLTYNADYLPKGKQINAEFQTVPLSIILDSIFGNPLLNYRIVGRQLVVFKPLPIRKTDSCQPALAKRYAGRVSDSKTGVPLPYASLGIGHKSIGVISNKDGIFVIRLPADLVNDTLVVSYMGYQARKIPVTDLKSFQTIGLQRKIVSLPEILIRTVSADVLVKKAVARIPDNYFRGAYTYRGFYREIIRKNKKYLSYTEALIDVYKHALRPTLYHDQVKVLKKRKFTDATARDTVMMKLQGGLDAMLRLDLVRHPPGFMQPGQLDKYTFSMRDITTLNGRLVYVITFSPRSSADLSPLSGEMYIDATSLAIVQVQFHYDRKALRTMKTRFVLRHKGRVDAFPVAARYRVVYQVFKGKYYVRYILGNIQFRVKQKHTWLRAVYDVAFEMMRTDINSTHPSRFASNETVKTNRIFSDLVPGYNLRYWNAANIMVPETNINRVLKNFKERDLMPGK